MSSNGQMFRADILKTVKMKDATKFRRLIKEHCESVIKKVVNLDTYDDNGELITLLDAAIEAESEKMVTLLLSLGADLHKENGNEYIPLHRAAFTRSPKMIEFLIQQGADVYARDSDTGETALHYAAMENNEAVLRVLIKHGLDINVKDNNGFTPLYQANFYPRVWDLGKVSYLIRNGAIIDDKILEAAKKLTARTGNSDTEDYLRGHYVRQQGVQKTISVAKSKRRSANEFATVRGKIPLSQAAEKSVASFLGTSSLHSITKKGRGTKGRKGRKQNKSHKRRKQNKKNKKSHRGKKTNKK